MALNIVEINKENYGFQNLPEKQPWNSKPKHISIGIMLSMLHTILFKQPKHVLELKLQDKNLILIAS